jgi:hypothetical protein
LANSHALIEWYKSEYFFHFWTLLIYVN